MSEVVKISRLVKKLSLEIVTGDEKSLDRVIVAGDISRPGLELTGYFNYYSHNRLQLFGGREISFAEQMIPGERLIIMRRLCSEDIPTFIISRGLSAPEEMIQVVNEDGIAVLRSPIPTSRLSEELSSYLDGRLAPQASAHGVLVDVYGLGVLIQGDSGIGKSEAVLELIKRSHRSTADDWVDVYRQDELAMIRELPKILEHLIEIRGIRITDVMNLSGASVVRDSTQVQLAVYLEAWTKGKEYGRLGSEDATVETTEVDIPQIKIPVRTRRDVAIIIEIIAMNFRARTMSFDATKTFEERLNRSIEGNSGND